MSSFIVSDTVITNPIFGDVDYRSWALSASDLSQADASPVTNWIAAGPAPSIVRTFNSYGSSENWSFPTYDADGSFDGTPAVLFDGTQKIMSSSFTPRDNPHSVIVIARADNPGTGTTNTARLWGSGIVGAPNIVVGTDDTVQLTCASTTLSLPNNHGWMGFGASWTDTELIFVSNEDSVAAVLATPPEAVNRNYIGGNASAVANGLKGAIKEIIFWDRALSATELQQRIADYLGT